MPRAWQKLDTKWNFVGIIRSENEYQKIDGKNQIISSSIKSHIAKDFNYFFPQIINTYDERCNTFTPSLDCKIKIAYSPIKKIGL